MGILKRLFAGKRSSSYSDGQLINMIKTGGTARETATMYLHDQCLGYPRKKLTASHYLEKEDIVHAYSKSIINLIHFVESDKFEAGRAKLSTLIKNFFECRCTDIARQLKSRHHKETAEATALTFDESSPARIEASQEIVVTNSAKRPATSRQRIVTSESVDDYITIQSENRNAEDHLMGESFVTEALKDLSAKERNILFDHKDGFSNDEIAQRHQLEDSIKVSHALYAIRIKVKKKIAWMRENGW